jgi:tetratricopeptide (TPR) repeat protein
LQSLLNPRYQQYLRREYPQLGPASAASNTVRSASTAQLKTNAMELRQEQAQLLTRLLQTNRLYYLHPGCGSFFEQYYLEPRGLVYKMAQYPTNAFNPPPLSTTTLASNEVFWNRAIESVVDPLRALIARWESPRSGFRKHLARFARLDLFTPLELKLVAQWQAGALNTWGVTLQRHGQLKAATRCFERAQQLNAENLTASVNLQCNTNLLGDRKLTVVQSASIDELTRRRLTPNELVAEDGPVDDPSYCFQMGLVLKTNRLFRQSGQQFERVKTLAPSSLAARLNLGGQLNQGDMSSKVLALLAEIRADPTLQPLVPAAQKEMTFLETEAWFNALRATHRQLKANSNDASALLNEGIILIRLGAPTNAIPSFTRVLALTNSPVALLHRAAAYLEIGYLEAPRADYWKLWQASSNDPRVYYGLGEIAWRRGQTNAAIGYYQSYLAFADPKTDGAKFIATRLKALRQGSP